MNNNDETMLDENQSNTLVKRCPNCGGLPGYDIASGKLVCAHCNFSQDIESDDKVQRRQLTDEIKRSKRTWDEGTVFRCTQCGVKEVLTQKDITRRCAFCGNSNIVSANELSGIKPDSLIPFKIDIERARNIFRKWINSKWLAPRMFKTYDIREHMNALYCPSWAFTSNVIGTYNGTFGRRVTTKTRGANGQMITRTQINYFNASGNMSLNYTDHIVQSSDRIAPIVFNTLKPFDLKEIRAYRTEFITGIVTEHYTKELETCFNEFSNFIRSDLRRRIMQKHNADTVQRLNLNTNFQSKQFNYILLPLYISNYNYKNKTYNFFINGVSGKIVGKYPKSKPKMFFLFLGIGILVAGALGLIYYLST